METESALEQDKAVALTDRDERSLTTERALRPSITHSIRENSRTGQVFINPHNTAEPSTQSVITANEQFSNKRNEIEHENRSGSSVINYVRSQYEVCRRRPRDCNTNEAVIVRTDGLRNNVCNGYGHKDDWDSATGDRTATCDNVEPAMPSVHQRSSYSRTSRLQQRAAVFSYPSPAKEGVRIDTNASKAGISSIQRSAPTNAFISKTAPNRLAQSKQRSASVATSEGNLNERKSDSPDTPSDDVCTPVAKATWNNLPDSQIVQNNSRWWQPVKRNVSSSNLDSELRDNRTSGSTYYYFSRTSQPGGERSRIIPIQHTSAGRRRLRCTFQEDLHRRYSAPTTTEQDSRNKNSRASVEFNATNIQASTTTPIQPVVTTQSCCVYDSENNIVTAKLFQPSLTKHYSLDYDTLNIAPPEGNTNPQMAATVDELNSAWRRKRPPLPRGSAAAEAQSEMKIERKRGLTGRPKSAEFLLENTVQESRVPSAKKGHVRSPSDGDKTMLLALENTLQADETDNGHQGTSKLTPQHDKSQGFLRKIFSFTKRSRSNDSGDGCNKGDSSSQRSRSLKSRSRSPSNRSRTPSNTSSMESTESHNNNSVLEKLSVMNARGYLRIHDETDENKNIEAPLPPIAVWSSDEDISSAPSTPRRKSHGCEGPNKQKVVLRKYSDNRDPKLLKTISPELEEQISASLRDPLKMKREVSEITHGDVEGLSVALYQGSPRRYIPSQGWRRYAVSRHHSAEAADQVAPTTAAPAAPAAPAISVKQPPRGPLLQHTRLKNHTVDLTSVVKELDKEVSICENPSLLRKVSSGNPPEDSRANSTRTISANPTRETPFGCILQSSTSTAPGYDYIDSFHNLVSNATTEQTESVPRRGHITRTSWGRRSPGGTDLPQTTVTNSTGHVENISTDSGIQQDSYESSSESLKVGHFGSDWDLWNGSIHPVCPRRLSDQNMSLPPCARKRTTKQSFVVRNRRLWRPTNHTVVHNKTFHLFEEPRNVEKCCFSVSRFPSHNRWQRHFVGRLRVFSCGEDLNPFAVCIDI